MSIASKIPKKLTPTELFQYLLIKPRESSQQKKRSQHQSGKRRPRTPDMARSVLAANIKKVMLNSVVALSTFSIYLQVLVARVKRKPILFLLGTPAHANLGDQAIAFAEYEFLDKYCPEYTLVELRLVSFDVFTKTLKLIRWLIRYDDIIIGHGGGNMGDQYLDEEKARRLFIDSLPSNRIIVFPQTIYFSDTKNGREEFEHTKRCYATHSDLTLIARENVSYNLMKQNFPNNNILLTPDIVLFLSSPLNIDVSRRKGAMTCLRKDKEKSATSGKEDVIRNILQRHYSSVFENDTLSDDRFLLTKNSRTSRLRKKWSEFYEVELVVTDRLHGMVFAAITGTPCVAFSNYNYKVNGTFQWIKNLEYIKYCDSVDKLEGTLKSLDIEKRYSYQADIMTDNWIKIKNVISS